MKKDNVEADRIRPNKIYVFPVACLKNNRVGRYM
jgi:hypothetical protein